jgi:hypothetical protein
MSMILKILIKAISNLKLNKIHRWFGWQDMVVPSEPCVCVFGHSSYWDIFILWLYSYSSCCKNLYAVAKPQIQNYPLLSRLNLLYGGKLEEKKSCTTDKLIEQFNLIDHTDTQPKLLFISPKGTIQNRPWRSGYYWIAKGCKVKIVPAFINFSDRKIEFGKTIDPNNHNVEETTNYLQEQLGKYRLLNMEKAEYKIEDKKCPYESLMPFDMCTVSLLPIIPYIIFVMLKGWWIQFVLSVMMLLAAFQYHMDYEGINIKDCRSFQKSELRLSVITIISQFLHSIYYGIKFSNIFYVSVLMQLFCYFYAIPRGNHKRTGKYIVFHSAHHVLGAITALSMLE